MREPRFEPIPVFTALLRPRPLSASLVLAALERWLENDLRFRR